MDKIEMEVDQRKGSHNQENSISGSLINFQQYVSVYLRKTNKRSYKVYLQTPIDLDQLFDEIQDTFLMNPKNITLYYHGKKYTFSDLRKSNSARSITLNLKSNEIIHIHEKKDRKQNITIYLQIYSGKNKLIRKQFQVSANQKIKQFLPNIKKCFEELRKINISLIQSGRKLDENLSFSEQDIDHQTSISILLEKSLIKLTEWVQDEIGKQKYNSYPPFQPSNLQKSQVCCSQNNRTPNFKKKLGRGIYKSSKKSSSDFPVWESDSSEEVSRKQLMKILLKKKNYEGNKKQNKTSSQLKRKQSLPNEKFTSKDRIHLKQQIRKLFNSQILNDSQTDLKKLQPPSIATDDMFEQIEEVQFGDDNDNLQTEDDYEVFGKPFDLKSSFEKKKKTPDLIPTRDFDHDIFKEDMEF